MVPPQELNIIPAINPDLSIQMQQEVSFDYSDPASSPNMHSSTMLTVIRKSQYDINGGSEDEDDDEDGHYNRVVEEENEGNSSFEHQMAPLHQMSGQFFGAQQHQNYQESLPRSNPIEFSNNSRGNYISSHHHQRPPSRGHSSNESNSNSSSLSTLSENSDLSGYQNFLLKNCINAAIPAGNGNNRPGHGNHDGPVNYSNYSQTLPGHQSSYGGSSVRSSLMSSNGSMTLGEKNNKKGKKWYQKF